MLKDGRSSITADALKGRCLVAIVLGDEPLKIDSDHELLNIDEIILDMARHIVEMRKVDSSRRNSARRASDSVNRAIDDRLRASRKHRRDAKAQPQEAT